VEPRFLVLETSHRVGTVALALGDTIIAERSLDDQRRHARDLAPAIDALVKAQAWRLRDLDGVIVSRGPGSYTGLRVGLMSAKALAYATGCALLAMDTFPAIASFSPLPPGEGPGVRENEHPLAVDRFLEESGPPLTPDPPGGRGEKCVDVIADAQQGNVYVQRFGKRAEALTIVPFEMWLESALALNVAVTGPGAETFASRLPSAMNVLPRESWFTRPASLLALGLARFRNGERDDPFAVEPTYLRASSAEVQWNQLHPTADTARESASGG